MLISGSWLPAQAAILGALGSQPVFLGASVPQFTFTPFLTKDSDKHWIFFFFSYFFETDVAHSGLKLSLC